MRRKKSKLRLPICAAAIMIGLQGNTFAVSANEQKEMAPTQVETVTEQEAATTQVETVTEQENISLKEETQVEEIQVEEIQDVVTIEEETSQLEADAKDFVIENNVLIVYLGKEKIVTIPEGVTSIGSNALIEKKL